MDAGQFFDVKPTVVPIGGAFPGRAPVAIVWSAIGSGLFKAWPKGSARRCIPMADTDGGYRFYQHIDTGTCAGPKSGFCDGFTPFAIIHTGTTP